VLLHHPEARRFYAGKFQHRIILNRILVEFLFACFTFSRELTSRRSENLVVKKVQLLATTTNSDSFIQNYYTTLKRLKLLQWCFFSQTIKS